MNSKTLLELILVLGLLLIPMKKMNKIKKCDVCKTTFSWKNNLKTHMLIYIGEKTNKCNIFPKSFSHKGHFNTHVLHVYS